MNITITDMHDPLSCTEYRFWVRADIGRTNVDVALDACFIMKKETTRHKFKVVKKYTSIDKRGNTMEKPFVPVQIREAARQQIINAIRFVE